MINSKGRARKGGEIGMNGEPYAGGQFLPSTEAPKGTFGISPAQTRRWYFESALRDAANEVGSADFIEWRMARIAALAASIAVLDGMGGFHADLAADLKCRGRLTDAQAHYAAKAIMGRETKKNADAWWALFESLTEAPE